MKDRPELDGHTFESDQWFSEYRQAMYERYCATLPDTSRRVQPSTLRIEGGPIAGPLGIFTRLSHEGKAAFITATPPEGLLTNWTRQVGRTSSTRAQIPSPIRWLYTTHGYVDSSQGICKVSRAVGPDLAEYAGVLPVAKIPPAISQRLQLKSKVEEIRPAQWSSLLDQVKASEDDEYIGRTYALLIRVALDLLNDEPTVRCRVGSQWELRPDHEVAVTTDTSDFRELVGQGQPAVLVGDPKDAAEAEFMVTEWGMLRYTDVIEKEVKPVLMGPAAALADALPAFKTRPGPQALRGYSVQECSELDELTRTPSGTTRKPLQSAKDGDVVLLRAGLSTVDQMAAVDQRLGFGIGRAKCESLLAHHRKLLESKEFQNKLMKIRSEPSITGKLSLLLDSDKLRAGLPEGLIASEVYESGADPSPARIAELAYSAFDEGVLREYAADIRAAYENAPARFDGTSSALRFVADLDFPDSFAGARIPAPPQREEARGPVDFPALHPYQDQVARRFVDFLSEPLPGRAMLSLPTGAGKTRVAAEAVIRWIRESGMPDGPILWIAQTTELCEQAIQSWRFVWEQVGPVENLVLDRLWTGNSSTPVTMRPHLVVATDAKLAVCLDTDEYAWLRNASLVIVDEAHTATSKEYTRIFEQLGLTRSKTHRNLVGLTATPFRNTEQLTNRLAGRFGNKRLDEGVLGDNPVARLQDLGVLSRVEHRELAGARLQLNSSELADAAKMKIDGVLPKSAERRLAADEARNTALLNEIEKMPSDWPILVFATSVDHARVLAAKLSGRGVRSVAIDSATPLPDRRRRIEEFRNGRVRVITNYGVLSQGFDAPATRAVIIARPVYSANIYQQMVGRGLRGIKNGGKDECLILDIKDNITNFDNKLAFNEFDYLWNGD
ncbi:DEAD/DEAH box helicase [Gordonia sp. DT218]